MKKFYGGLALLALAGILVWIALAYDRANQPIIEADEAKHPPRTTRLYLNNLQKGELSKELLEKAVQVPNDLYGFPTNLRWLAGNAEKTWATPWKGWAYNYIYLILPETIQLQIRFGKTTRKQAVHPNQRQLFWADISELKPEGQYYNARLRVEGNWLIATWRYCSRGKDSYYWGSACALTGAISSGLGTIILFIWAGGWRGCSRRKKTEFQALG